MTEKVNHHTDYLSKCCHAAYTSICSGEGTCHGRCTDCGKDCDLVLNDNWNLAKKPEVSYGYLEIDGIKTPSPIGGGGTFLELPLSNYRGIRNVICVSVLEGKGTVDSPYKIVEYVLAKQINGEYVSFGTVTPLTDEVRRSIGNDSNSCGI